MSCRFHSFVGGVFHVFQDPSRIGGVFDFDLCIKRLGESLLSFVGLGPFRCEALTSWKRAWTCAPSFEGERSHQNLGK